MNEARIHCVGYSPASVLVKGWELQAIKDTTRDRQSNRRIIRFMMAPFLLGMIENDGTVTDVVAGGLPLNYNIPSPAPVVKDKSPLFKKSNTLFTGSTKSKSTRYPSAFCRKDQACSASASGSSFLRPISTMAMMMNCTTPQSMVSRGVPVL